MAVRIRNSVAPSSESQMKYNRFLDISPNSDACLEHLKGRFFADGTECPKGKKASKSHRIKGRSAYPCQFGGHHVYPTAGTIFHKSTVSLQLWFFAIFLMSSTRCGISAKQLEREIGVTYKTAHRMFKQIRTLLADDDDGQLDGDVEVDESAYGGNFRATETHAQKLKQKNYRPTILALVGLFVYLTPLLVEVAWEDSLDLAFLVFVEVELHGRVFPGGGAFLLSPALRWPGLIFLY